MEELEHILKKFVHRSEASARFPHGIVHPRRDWLIILAVATLLILVLSGFSSLLFLRIEQGAAAVESGFQAPVQSLNRELLRENIELFEERKSMLETLRSQKPSIEQP